MGDKKSNGNWMNLNYGNQGSMWPWICLLIILMLFQANSMNNNIDAVDVETQVQTYLNNLDYSEAKIIEYEYDTTLRCSAFRLVFDTKGKRLYEVDFIDTSLGNTFVALVDAKEVEKGNVEKNALYQAKMSYAYIDKVFEKDLEQDRSATEKTIRSIAVGKYDYLKVYNDYVKLLKIEFMYSKELQNFNGSSGLHDLQQVLIEKQAKTE